MYRHQPIHEHLPLLGEYSFSSLEAPHRLVTFLNKTMKRRGIIFGLTQTASHEFKLSVYDLMLKESGATRSGRAAGSAVGSPEGRPGLASFVEEGPDEADDGLEAADPDNDDIDVGGADDDGDA
ncbi:MAG: DUF4264 family protein [Bacillota bacterium]